MQLRKQEAAAVAEVGVIRLELVAVIAQRQRRRQRAGDGHEAAEMVEPLRVAQRVEPDAGRRPLVAIAQREVRKLRRSDLVVEFGAEGEMGGGRFEDHASTRKLAVGPSPAAQPWGRWRRSRRRGWSHEPAQAATPFVTLARAISPMLRIGEGSRLRRPMLIS